MDIMTNTVRLKQKIFTKRFIPDHLVKPVVEVRAMVLAPVIPTKLIRSATGRPLTLKEKKNAIEE